MEKGLKNGLSLLVVMVIFVLLMPVSAWAEETSGENEAIVGQGTINIENLTTQKGAVSEVNEKSLTVAEQALISESLNTYNGGTQTAIFPMDYLRVTQITHDSTVSDAVDFGGLDAYGSDNVFAPFDAVVVDKMTSYAMGNTVVIQSRSPVKYADGTVDFMTVSFTHDNDVGDIWVGRNLTKGEVFYQEGTAGYATGNHIHMICSRGQYGVNTTWDHSLSYNGLTNSLWPDKALFISDRTKIIHSWWFYWLADLPSVMSVPNISNIQITDINAEGFTVRCTVTDDVGVTRVNYATWTDENGQDELNFVDGWLSGSDSSFRVLYSDHKNERGSYKVDIRAYDAAGNVGGPITEGITIESKPPVISDLEITDINASGYTIKLKATDESGIARVQFPTWTTANGQDDLVNDWGNNASVSGTIEGDMVTFRVKDSVHNYEKGEYITHIHAYDKYGNESGYEVKAVNLENSGVPTVQETLGNNSYLLYDDAMTWPEAKIKAEELGGHLVTICSQEEQMLIEKMVQNGQRGPYFIGGTDEGQEGTFSWVTGEPFGLAKWSPGEPNNGVGIENYLEFYNNGCWNDIPANVKRGFIVEKESTTGDGSESKLISYLGKDSGGNYYRYSATEFNNSFLAYQINPVLASAKMYQQYLNSQCKIVGLEDQAKGYMDYNATASACLKAQMWGQTFDINVYFASSDARKLTETVGVVKIVDKDGNVS